MPLGANVVCAMQGQLGWIHQDSKGFQLDLEIDMVDYKFPNPQPQHLAPVIKNSPFAAHVTMDRSKEVPITIRITEGAVKTDARVLNLQYKTAYLILEMMCITALDMTFTEAIIGADLEVEFTYPEKINLGEWDGMDVLRLVEGSRAALFRGYPVLSGSTSQRTQLYSFSFGDDGHVSLFTRLLDHKTNCATHAVNLEATLLTQTENLNYLSLLEKLKSPAGLQNFIMFEFEIIDGMVLSGNNKSRSGKMPAKAPWNWTISSVALGSVVVALAATVGLLLRNNGRRKNAQTSKEE